MTQKRSMTIEFTIPRYWRGIGVSKGLSWNEVNTEIISFKNYYIERPETELSDAGWERRWRAWVAEILALKERVQHVPETAPYVPSFNHDVARFHLQQAMAILKR